MSRTITRISSSLYGNFQHPTAALLFVLAAGCSGGDEQDSLCANPEEPAVLELTNLTPAFGAVVANQDIVHSFTVLNAAGTFTSLVFARAETHTAGAPTPALKFEPMSTGADLTYTFESVVWATDGHVELVELGEYTDSDVCFILPRPVFAYDVTD